MTKPQIQYTVNPETKEIQLLVRKSPLIHHAKWVERLQADYPDYKILPPK